MQDIRAALQRIEHQNLAILARLVPQSRKNLAADEVATRINRSPWTVRQLCAAGLIRATKDNGTWRIPVNEVERLEQEGVPRLLRK